MIELEERLRTHRFAISEQSRIVLQQLQEIVPFLNEELSLIQGIGVMGSRVKGYDRLDSDLDIVVFVRSSSLLPDSGINYHVEQRCRELTWDLINVSCGVCPQIEAVVDIGEVHLSKLLKEFFNDYKVKKCVSILNKKNRNRSLLNDGRIYACVFDLMSPFFLTMGREVYEAREFILSSFSRHFLGNQYFAVLMETLSDFERYEGPKERGRLGVPYEGPFPQTISEARTYFLTK